MLMIHPAMPAARFDDAALVAECLNGNCDAFRRIVEQYQTLISSIAYCATGDVTVSEDLAQETFVSAWKQLPQLREPAKLRSWLCSIVRFLISKEFRRRDGEPVDGAEPLAAVEEWASPEPLPADHVMTQEERAILWRSLERIPEIYREPLVLYYRENQSVEAVAQNLDLTEDAVKQRLSRGRKLLQEQVLAFVEAALKHTKPDKAFALGVLAALPLATTTVKAATATVALKGGSSVNAASSLAMLSAILTAGALYFISLIAFLVFSGACVGWMMSRACRRSAANLNDVARHWRLLAIAFLGIVTPSLLLNKCIPVPAWSHTYDGIVTWYLFLAYVLFGGALITWLFRWWRSLQTAITDSELSVSSRLKQRLGLWLGLGLLLPGLMCSFLIYCAIAESTITSRHISTTEAETMIAGHKDADVLLTVYASGVKYLKIMLPETRRQVAYFLVADQPAMDALDKSGIHYQTRIEGRDFSEEGLTWKGLLLLVIFVTSMGGVLVAAGPWKQHGFQRREAEARRDERTAKAAFKAFSVCVAVVLLALAIFVGAIARWRVPSVSLAEIKTMAPELKTSQ
ncbi:MAG TPA: sigma-70 family RNA polymerase sigma factor, partial [Verrucomicrobiae bacterium]